MRDLAHGFATQSRVVFALALRETRTRFGKNQLGYFWALAEPSFYILTFFGMFSLVGKTTPGGMAIIPFLATGFIPYQLVVSSADRVGKAVEGNRGLLFYPHVQPLDIVFARAILELATYLIVFAILVGGYCAFTRTFVVDDILLVLGTMVLTGLLGTALGTVLCALNVLSPTVDRIKQPLMKPLFWISGLFFTANMIPAQYRQYLMWNPILHCTELIRTGWFPQYESLDARPTYVMVWIVGLAFVGLTLERRVRPKVQLS